ncbi:MAG: serpin family protein [Lachnospiraceae bacterium]|nr:serpin family protein [Lachnospiraceae bacterium]
MEIRKKWQIKKCICVLFIVSVLLCNMLYGSIPFSSGDGMSRVSAAGKSTGTKNLTKSIKVKSKKGRAMTEKEAGALSSSSFKILDTVMDGESADKNVLISPVSILYAFGMAENGAKGATRSQLEAVVNGGVKSSELNKVLAATRRQMIKDKNVSWNIANSVWYRKRKDVKVKKAFLKKVKAYYGAEVYRAPFNAGTVKDVNAWVKKNTKKMIPKIIKKIDSTDVMYLINAMAFEGEWATQFTDKQVLKEQDFTNIDGSISKVTMLTGGESRYFELNGAYGFKKNYKGGKYSFVGIDVPEGVTTSDYVKQLSEDGSAFVSALGNMKSAIVTVKFPEYKLDYDVEMSGALKKLGAVDAFDGDKADLYNMFEKDKGSNYYFSAVYHKTHIEVDKKGTKAAAATAIVVSKTTSVVTDNLAKIEITLDHPFVYAIVDNTTNIPVFVGVVNRLGE